MPATLSVEAALIAAANGTLAAGTIIADNNSNTLTIAAPLLNSGTVQSSASGGGSILLISGTASGNLSGGTLTAGTYLSQGSASTENAIRFAMYVATGRGPLAQPTGFTSV